MEHVEGNKEIFDLVDEIFFFYHHVVVVVVKMHFRTNNTLT